jgi:EF hand
MLSGFLYDWRRLAWIGLLLIGCSRSPTSVAVPEWDPGAAADRALSDYDSDGDRKLSREELKKCPGLLSALGRFDGDGDGSISGDELKSKLQEIRQDEAALVEITCTVMRDNQPLEGATVQFVPESFMGEAFKPATGVTARDGTTFPTVAEDELPAEYRGLVHGVHCGIFRVTVTHPNIDVPAKYNTQTELGRVVTRRDHDMLTINF